MLQTLRETYKIDDKRIYATGHSNGGGFTYLLIEARNNVLAAAAPSAAAAIRALSRMKPKPIMHLIGEQDPLVKPEWQKMTIEGMKKLMVAAVKESLMLLIVRYIVPIPVIRLLYINIMAGIYFRRKLMQ